MAKRPGMMRWGLAGSLTFGLSKGFEAMGDAAPYAADGVSIDRLYWHMLALVLFIATAAFGFLFLRGLWGRYVTPQRTGGGSGLTPRRDAEVFADEGDFDPDAALSRYMASRAEPQEPVAPRPSGFGRKRV